MRTQEIRTTWSGREESNEVQGKVMVVDSDRETQGALVYALDSIGLEVAVCENAVEALLKSIFEEFDYIIGAFELPGMKGIELVSRLRERFPNAIIIGMSGVDKGKDFLCAGANDFLQKPFVPYRIAMMIDGGDILA